VARSNAWGEPGTLTEALEVSTPSLFLFDSYFVVWAGKLISGVVDILLLQKRLFILLQAALSISKNVRRKSMIYEQKTRGKKTNKKTKDGQGLLTHISTMLLTHISRTLSFNWF
jgi:hypothetical protein